MNNKSFLTTNPEIFKRATETPANRSIQLQEIDLGDIAATLLQDQKLKIREFEVQISAYEVQIAGEKKNKVDHKPYIETVERQISQIRNQQLYINEQIHNCQLVESQVTYMEYYLWKKKQRINTYDASIAQLCRDMETEHYELEKIIQECKREGEDLAVQIQKLEDRIVQLNSSDNEVSIPVRPVSGQSGSLEQLFAANVNLKQEYSTLSSTRQFLQENKDIVAMQINDNIRSIQSTLKSYFQNEKIKLVKEFKQIQGDSKFLEVLPLNQEEQNYKIDPLLADYTFKLKELYASAPENMKKVVVSILQPMAWEKFYWKDFLEVEAKSEQIYSEYRKLQSQYMDLESKNEKIKHQIKDKSHELMSEAQKSQQISENIQKLKRRLKK